MKQVSDLGLPTLLHGDLELLEAETFEIQDYEDGMTEELGGSTSTSSSSCCSSCCSCTSSSSSCA
ncbi:thiazolylpeptide-type bacteriocin [Sphaerimonospora sp. CA-214678]|uniref:thiazolylpeptide-type bacteriocin n=1 Tax=Sphaerimonospora sp. CA-214678 TaxID=3240029 RepID=UPI003D8CF9D3